MQYFEGSKQLKREKFSNIRTALTTFLLEIGLNCQRDAFKFNVIPNLVAINLKQDATLKFWSTQNAV